MRKQTKRVLTLLLALILCLGLLPMAVMAASTDTSSVDSTPPLERDEGATTGNVNTGPSGGVTGPVGDPSGDRTEGSYEISQEFNIIFDANGGKYADGNTQKTLRTQSVTGGNGEVQHLVAIPNETPTREGYRFVCWYLVSPTENPGIANINFTKSEIVKAHWEPAGKYEIGLIPDPGKLPAGASDLLFLDNPVVPELPTPVREGYVFEGWYDTLDYDHQVRAGDTITDSVMKLVAKWKRASKTTPSVVVKPRVIDIGAEKVEVTLACPVGNVCLDWRPLERTLYSNGQPSDWETAAKSLLSGNFGDVGLRLTKISYGRSYENINHNAYPGEYYPDGIYPVRELILTLEGKAKRGYVDLQLSGNNFLEVVPEGGKEILDASSSDIFNTAKARFQVGSNLTNLDGPFTVKFDLNYKDPKQSEIPKDQTVAKGAAVNLPDGKKLTAPFTSHEFYAWCMKDQDGKLYTWKESTPVTADMTLYAGWVRKGTVIKDGEAVPDAAQPAGTQKPAETAPAAPKFTDVAATSPFAPAISWAVEKGITNGKTATTFGPGEPCTRAQIVTFLWRAAGSPEPKTMEAEYADVVNASAYYYKAIQWAAEMGMEESGTFAPDKTCTRGQAMYFIWKANDSGTSAGSVPSFKDLPKDSLYYDAVLWAVGQGVTKGTGDGTTFSPDNPCTRGQIVTFLNRAYVK